MDNPTKIIHLAKQRMSFGHFADKLLWFLMTATSMYVATQIRDLGKSFTELNEKVAVIIYQISEGSRRTDNLEKRVERLEEKRPRH